MAPIVERDEEEGGGVGVVIEGEYPPVASLPVEIGAGVDVNEIEVAEVGESTTTTVGGRGGNGGGGAAAAVAGSSAANNNNTANSAASAAVKKPRHQPQEDEDDDEKWNLTFKEPAPRPGVVGVLLRCAWKTFKGAEWLGEKLADIFGLNDSRYQWVVDEYMNMKEEEIRKANQQLEEEGRQLENLEGGEARGGGEGNNNNSNITSIPAISTSSDGVFDGAAASKDVGIKV